MHLPQGIVENITKAKENSVNLNMEKYDKKRTKDPSWGPMLVERQRRGQNQGGSVLQRAMELKKMKNLEPTKGNIFHILQLPELDQISEVVDIKIGHNKSESINIIKNMIVSETNRCEKFARDNPEIMLPVNLDVYNINEPTNEVVQDLNVVLSEETECGVPDLQNNEDEHGNTASPQGSLKDLASSKLWSEVVKRGKHRGKARTRNMKMLSNERGLLEY
jgi:hypothetical protein